MSITFYTLDVGHGLCQVIRFGDRAILIDGGGRIGKRIGEDFLKRYIRVVVAYVATHNDADHVAAAPELLNNYPTASTLHSIWLLLDRPAATSSQTDEMVIPLLGYSKRRQEQGTIGSRHALYVYDDLPNEARLIHREDSESAELQVIFPRILDTSSAVIRGQPNAAATNQVSAILRLVVDASQHRASALITGDANCQSFQIAHQYGFKLDARVLSIPHHGGEIPNPSGSANWATVVDWIAPEIAVVSAGYGTVPPSTTTKRETFDAFRKSDIITCCTQITKHCHPNYQSFHPSVVPPSRRPLPQMSGTIDYPSAVACAGTITIKVAPAGDVTLVRRHAHQDAVDDKVLPKPGCPHCRASTQAN